MSAHKTVLIVDDSADLRELLRITIERGPYRVVEAADGEQALCAVSAKRPDLVLLDVELPKMDGFEVCQQIKADEGTRSIKVLMLTAAVQEHDRERGEAVGADGYITKPFSLRALLTRLGDELGAGAPAAEAIPSAPTAPPT